MAENLCHRYSARGKSFETGIVRYSCRYVYCIVPLCQVYCSKIVNTDHPIKIKHFHMLCTIRQKKCMLVFWKSYTRYLRDTFN